LTQSALSHPLEHDPVRELTGSKRHHPEQRGVHRRHAEGVDEGDVRSHQQEPRTAHRVDGEVEEERGDQGEEVQVGKGVGQHVPGEVPPREEQNADGASDGEGEANDPEVDWARVAIHGPISSRGR